MGLAATFPTVIEPLVPALPATALGNVTSVTLITAFVPVPVSETSRVGVMGSLLLIVSVAARAPAPDGFIVTVQARLIPTGIVAGNVGAALTVKSDAFVPETMTALDEIYANHAMVLHCALDLLAVSWRSKRLREEQSRLGGVGAQGERLAALTARLKRLADGA